MERTALEQYFEEMGHTPLLTEEQERTLSARVMKGDSRAVQQLAEANLRFVAAIARQYQGKGLDMDDLISEGNIGLLKAAAKYDATRGLRFANYAVVFIRRQIEKALQHESSERMVESRGDGSKRSLDAPLGAKPTVSLMAVLQNADSPLADSRLHSNASLEAVERAMLRLSERQSQVVAACYGVGRDRLTMAEIAEEMGLKRERVRQIRDQALRHIRKALRN